MITQIGCSDEAGLKSSQGVKTAGPSQGRVWGGINLNTDVAAAQLLHSCGVALAEGSPTASALKRFPKELQGRTFLSSQWHLLTKDLTLYSGK